MSTPIEGHRPSHIGGVPHGNIPVDEDELTGEEDAIDVLRKNAPSTSERIIGAGIHLLGGAVVAAGGWMLLRGDDPGYYKALGCTLMIVGGALASLGSSMGGLGVNRGEDALVASGQDLADAIMDPVDDDELEEVSDADDDELYEEEISDDDEDDGNMREIQGNPRG